MVRRISTEALSPGGKEIVAALALAEDAARAALPEEKPFEPVRNRSRYTRRRINEGLGTPEDFARIAEREG